MKNKRSKRDGAFCFVFELVWAGLFYFRISYEGE